MDGCKQNGEGLLVDMVKRLRGGSGGQDGTFELEFRPGVVLEFAVEPGGSRRPRW